MDTEKQDLGLGLDSAQGVLEFQRRSRELYAQLPEDPDLTASSDAVWRLIRVAKLLEKHLEQQVHRPLGWSWTGFRVMYNTSVLGTAEPAVLAKLLGISPPSISSALATLESKQLITRTQNEENQAKVDVRLTPRARDLMPEVLAQQRRAEHEFMAALTFKDRQALGRLLESLLEARWDAWRD